MVRGKPEGAAPPSATSSTSNQATIALSRALSAGVLANNCMGILLDMIPADGVMRPFTPEEETTLGLGLERATSRCLRPSSRSRIQCTETFSPEMFYAQVYSATQICAQYRLQVNSRSSATPGGEPAPPGGGPPPPLVAPGSPAAAPEGFPVNKPPGTASGKPIPHVLIVQDVERLPKRTLACLDELLSTRGMSSPGVISSLFAGAPVPERFQCPIYFIVLATTCNLPRPAVGTTLSDLAPQYPEDPELPDRLLSSFFVRIPIILPRAAAAAEPPPAASSAAAAAVAEHASLAQGSLTSGLSTTTTSYQSPYTVFASVAITSRVRDICSALQAQEAVLCGPGGRPVDALLLAAKIHASLRGSSFVAPLDIDGCVVDVLAHRLVMRDPRRDSLDSGDLDGDASRADEPAVHPVMAARRLVWRVANNFRAL